MPIFNNILAGASGQSTGYDIDQSLRFNDDDSAYLNRTPSSAGNCKTWTWSGWVKRGNLGINQNIFNAYEINVRGFYFQFTNTDVINIGDYIDNTGWQWHLTTTAVYRDVGSWYHIVLKVDTTQATSSDRVKLYINGEQVTSFSTSTYPSLNWDGEVNRTIEHNIGRIFANTWHLDAYLSEVNFIDGTALTPASFGETNSATNQWVPIEVTGLTYGTNGFYQKYSATELATSFSDSSGSEYYVTSDRTSEITVTSDLSIYLGDNDGSNLNTQVNGSTANSNPRWYPNGYTSIAGKYLRYDFGAGNEKIITEAKWYQDTTQTQGTWKWQGSNNATTWTDIGSSFTLGDGATGTSNPQTQTQLNGNTTAYRYYQLVNVSGSGGTIAYWLEIQFQQKNHKVTANGNITNSRAQSKFSSSAVYSSTTSEFLSTSPHILLPQEFTWEGWVRFDNATPGETSFFNLWDPSSIGGHDNRSYRIWFQNGSPSKIGFAVSSDGDNPNSSEIFWNWTPSQNTWYYISVGRDSSDDCRAFVDGSAIGTTQELSRTAFTPNTAATENYLGGSNGVWYQDVQFSTTNRYTSTYSVPTASVAADSNTVFLVNSDFNGGLGADSSGNKNDFTPTNLVATDVVGDSPTNNFATLNPLDPATNQTLSEGNLKQVTSGQGISKGTMQIPSSGKWYWEVCQTDTDQLVIGIAKPTATLSNYLGSDANGWGYGGYDGSLYNNGSGSSYGNTYTNGDIVGVAFDADNQAVYFSKNNTWQNSGDPTSGSSKTGAAVSSLTDEYSPASGSQNSSGVYNFGQDSSFAGNKTAQGNADGNDIGDFYYSPPSGFLALCTDNLPDPAIALPTAHFDTQLWTGTGAGQTFSNFTFQPDFLWFKQRNGSSSHALFDSVRGVNAGLDSGSPAVENTVASGSQDLVSFDDDGFTTGTPSQYGSLGSNTNTIATWAWKAGGTAATKAAGNIDGTNPTIASSVSANTTSGFSIVSYTGNGTDSATVEHGLSAKPELVIVKNLDSSAAWIVGSQYLTSSSYVIILNVADAEYSSANKFSEDAPTASVVVLGDADETNKSTEDFIAYCFHSVEGYSKVGSFTEAASPYSFVYTGFKPAWVMWKATGVSDSWIIMDNKRNTYNVMNSRLFADMTNAQSTTQSPLDFVSNGFKFRAAIGAASREYIYLAFAESPFKTSNAR